MKYCKTCGAECPDTEQRCHICGAMFEGADSNHAENTNSSGTYGNQGNPYSQSNPNGQVPPNHDGYNSGNYAGGYSNRPRRNITERNIALAILFTLVTCGIYGIYWMIMLNDDVNELANEPNATSGGMVFLLSLITCGIYRVYWLYKMGERSDRIKGQMGSSNILYMILALLGFDIIVYCLLQDTVNKYAN